jgi:hypothetical protein
MNAEDLAMLTALTVRTGELLARLYIVASLAGNSDAAAELRADLEQANEAVGHLVWRVQDREARSWGRLDHRPRNPAPPRLTARVPLSTEIDHGVHVQRITMQGTPAAEVTARPTTSGVWKQGRLGKPRSERA